MLCLETLVYIYQTFASEGEAQAAIQGMNEQELDNRRLRVNLANSRPAGGAGGGKSTPSLAV